MEIEGSFTSNSTGKDIRVVYKESDPLEDLDGKTLHSVHCFCFYKDKMVLVNHPRSGWVPLGGGIDGKETYEETVVREAKEESNMEVIYQELIGFQDSYGEDGTVRQTRSFCKVKPYGPFINDPDGEIKEIKLINPKDYKKYFDWGEIGDRIMERAVDLNNIENTPG